MMQTIRMNVCIGCKQPGGTFVRLKTPKGSPRLYSHPKCIKESVNVMADLVLSLFRKNDEDSNKV